MPPTHTFVYKKLFLLFLVTTFTLSVLLFPMLSHAETGAPTILAQAPAVDPDEGAVRSAEQAARAPVPALDELIANAEARLRAIDTVELLVQLEQYSPSDGSITHGKGRLSARLPDVFRFDWLQPDMMAGSILLVDKPANEARQYNPIREEIIVQRWDHLAAQQNLGPEIDRWLAVPSPDEFMLQSGGVETINGRDTYVVLARPHEAPELLYEFLIDPETWLISHFRQYDGNGRLALRGSLTDVRINGDLSARTISAMPPFARVRYR